MIAAALALGATIEQPIPWKATQAEQVAVWRAMERYARGGVTDRIEAANDMDQIITRIVVRACEELGATGSAGPHQIPHNNRERGIVGSLGQARETCAPRCAGQNSTVIASAVGSRS